jgi:TolB-like protein/Flp pilus assembly protein TadD
VSIGPGQQVRHYRLVEQIGEGGMGVVWKAEDPRLQRCVALKFVPEKQEGDGGSVDRHLREARAASALNHPNICSIFDIGDWNGRRFIVMELLEGRSLDRKIAGAPLDVEQAVELGIQIGGALAAAHAKGIVHRDIKPQNIFVTHDGTAKMLDFGLAKLATPETPAGTATQTALDRTQPGSVVGTVAYMSPEQALGKELDARTDVFSLGVVLYEMITGRRAFEGNTSAAVFDAILNRAPTAPVEFNPNVPPELQHVVNRALEKDPGLRYQSAADLVADLKRLLRGQTSSHSVVTPAAPRRRRWPGLVGATAVVVVLAALGVVLLRPDEPAAPREPPAPGGRPSIAVLPFTNTSGDANQEYFSIGLTEDIITELSRYNELAVIAHFATADFQRQHADAELSEIAETLRARYVLQGNVFRQGERIRINVRLSDAAEGRSLWGTTYERDLTVQDLFAIQDDLTQQVVSAIAGSYGALARAGLSAIRGKPPSELSSYDCVLRTYDYLQNHTTENHALARACLERVVEAEPEYAEALAWLGYIYAEEYHHRRNERPDEYDALERALELGLEALRLENASHVTHGNLGLTYYFRGDYERGIVESRRAHELAPNHAMWLAIVGLYYIQRENFEEGVPMVNRAIELFTPHPPAWVRMATFLDHYAHERYEQALAELRATDLGEDFRYPMFLAATYGQLGLTEETPPVLAELRRLWPYPLAELRREMIERHAHSAGLVDHLMQGLEIAGADLSPP